ncbi:hypothetical protein QE152_g41028, partial [Popillia japonica]
LSSRRYCILATQYRIFLCNFPLPGYNMLLRDVDATE